MIGLCSSGPPWPWSPRCSSRCGAARSDPSGRRTCGISSARANTAGATRTCSASPPTAASAPSTSSTALSAIAAACARTSSACAGPIAAWPARRSWPPLVRADPWSTAGSAGTCPSPATARCANSSAEPSRSCAISGESRSPHARRGACM